MTLITNKSINKGLSSILINTFCDMVGKIKEESVKDIKVFDDRTEVELKNGEVIVYTAKIK